MNIPIKKCCTQYPNCIHYIEWDKPAEKIDKHNAILFHNIMCESITPILKKWIEEENYKEIVDSLKQNLAILPLSLQRLFIEKVTNFLHYTLHAHFISIHAGLGSSRLPLSG